MTARAFAYIAIAATMLAGSAAAQQPSPGPDLFSAQRAATPQPPGRNPGQPQPVAPQPQPGAPAPVLGPEGPPAPAAPAPAAGPRPLRENQSINVRIEVTVTDERPGIAPIKKTVSIVTADGLNGSVRSSTNYQAAGAGQGSAPFNVDATAIIMTDNKVHTRLTFEYAVIPPPLPAQGEPQSGGVRLLGTTIRDGMALVLENGKPLVVVQSTDPVSDRKVSVEVKATILK